MTAKEQAILDIKEDLKNQGKSFLAFHQELNRPIGQILRNHLRNQLKLTRK